jgi:hypothetical protein
VTRVVAVHDDLFGLPVTTGVVGEYVNQYSSQDAARDAVGSAALRRLTRLKVLLTEKKSQRAASVALYYPQCGQRRCLVCLEARRRCPHVACLTFVVHDCL